jgi:DNA-binding NtrC family response regulator
MPYIFRQKLNLTELTGEEFSPKRVLIFEPEEYLAGIYSDYLTAQNFQVQQRQDLYELHEVLIKFVPHVLIFNAEFLPNHSKNQAWLLSVKKAYPQLHLVTTGYNLNSESVGQLMTAGVSSHINRRLSRPQDLAIIVKSILYNNK